MKTVAKLVCCPASKLTNHMSWNEILRFVQNDRKCSLLFVILSAVCGAKNLIPPAIAIKNLRDTTLAGVLVVLTVLAGCGHEVAPEQPETDSGMLVSVAPVRRGTISSEAVFPGVTVALKQLTVRSPASGIVESLNVQPGDRLARGQTIARVVTREDVAARNGVKVAQQMRSGDEKEMAAAVERYASSPGIAVIAPDSATVAKRVASSGQFVNEFDPIAELVDLRSIYVEGSAPLRLMQDIRRGASALVMSPALAKPAPAKIVAILPSSSASQTFGMKIAFVAPESPIVEAGAAVNVSVVMATHPDALLIPTSALFVNAQDNSNYLFVADPDHLARRVAVKVGLRDQNHVEITAGLVANQNVITSGGYALSDGLKIHWNNSPTAAGSS